MSKITPFTELAIMDCLRKHPGTITTISEETGFGYYSVRTVVRDLQKRNVIRTAGYKNRHEVFKLNLEEGAKSTIPFLWDETKLQNVKSFNMLAAVGKKDTNAVRAAQELPNYVARIFYTAVKYAHGQSPKQTAATHALLKSEMEAARKAIRNAAAFYDQILDNPKFWDKDFLLDFTNDMDWDQDAVMEAYAKIYGEDHTELQVPGD